MKTFLKIVLSIVIILFISLILGPKVSYESVNAHPLSLDLDINKVERYVQNKELENVDIKPGNEAHIIWANQDDKTQTEYALVYLHGFTASHREGFPIIQNLSKEFGFNVYLSRLAQHGLTELNALQDITPQLLVESAKEAIAIGKILGKKIIVFSTSTGSTLSSYLASEDKNICAQLMLAPNFDLADKNTKLLTKPWGKQIFRHMMGGDYRTWNAPPEIQKYWTTKNRIEGYIALRDLLDQTMTKDIWSKNTTPTFIGYYYVNDVIHDKIISIDAINEFKKSVSIPEDNLKIIPFADAQGHVIGSQYMNDNWQSVQDSLSQFLSDNIIN